jgi:hypothetical protein
VNDAHVQARLTALQAAVDLQVRTGAFTLQPGVDVEVTVAAAYAAIRETADIFWAWAVGTTALRITPGPITSQATGQPTGTQPPTEGNTMQLHDDEQVTYTVDTEDAKGFDTNEVLEWAADNADVVTLVPGENGRTCTVLAGVPGSAVVTVTAPNLDPPLSATEAIDVLPGGTATITLAAGDITKQ